jgi:hypothetical protein
VSARGDWSSLLDSTQSDNIGGSDEVLGTSIRSSGSGCRCRDPDGSDRHS